MKNFYNLIPLIPFLFIVGCNTEQKIEKNDIENINLIGKVKTIKTIKYDVIDKFGKLTKGDKLFI